MTPDQVYDLSLAAEKILDKEQPEQKTNFEIHANRHQKRTLLGALRRAKRQAAKQRARASKRARNV